MVCWLVSWAIFGLFVGGIARMVWPGHEPLGCTMTIFLGVTGSVLGGMLTYALTGGPDRYYQPAGWIMSVIGAIVMLWLFSDESRRRWPD